MFSCDILCSNNYMSFKALRQHALQKHPDEVESAVSRPEKNTSVVNVISNIIINNPFRDTKKVNIM